MRVRSSPCAHVQSAEVDWMCGDVACGDRNLRLWQSKYIIRQYSVEAHFNRMNFCIFSHSHTMSFFFCTILTNYIYNKIATNSFENLYSIYHMALLNV